jgi:elongation factor P
VLGTPWQITEFLHVKPGKGPAFVRTKMKNLLSGNSNEKTWRAGESVTAADVNTFEAQYSYEEDDNYVFMDSEYVECPETCVS